MIFAYCVEVCSTLLTHIKLFGQDLADFQYIDVWSSPYTWNNSMPEAGDFVVVQDMTVLLDIDTPILTMLLIKGKIMSCIYFQQVFLPPSITLWSSPTLHLTPAPFSGCRLTAVAVRPVH